MKARCGLEDCDCEYTIGKLLAALKEAPLPTVVGTAFREWYYGERQAAIAKAEEALGCPTP